MNATKSTATILLVDDEAYITDALQRNLRREPYRFLTATSGAAALEILEHQHVDVVISDERMPSMSGSEFLSVVRKQYPHTIRMILSGQATLEAAVRAINEGEVHRFFIKPCNAADLIVTVQQALAHKRLEAQSWRLLRQYQRQASMLERVRLESPGLTHLDTDDQGAVVVDEDDSNCELTDLLGQMEQAMSARSGSLR